MSRRRIREGAALSGAILCLAFGAAVQATPLCEDPAGVCGAEMSAQCAGSFGAGAIAADDAGDCADQFNAYRACLARAVSECGNGARPRGAPSGVEFTPAPSPEERAAESAAGSIDLGGVAFSFDGCRHGATDRLSTLRFITCDFSVESLEEDRSFSIDREESRIFAPDGSAHSFLSKLGGRALARDPIPLTRSVPLRGEIFLMAVPPYGDFRGAASAPLLRIVTNFGTIDLHDVPLAAATFPDR